MRHILFAVSVAALPGAAHASEQPLYLGGRFGMLAIESGATTRAPAIEFAVAARWALAGFAGPSLSYRGGWRSAGGEKVGMSTQVHRVQAGVFAQKNWQRVLVGAELGVHQRFQSSRFRAGDQESEATRSRNWGAGADAWFGVRLADSLSGSLVFGGYQRDALLDLTLGLALDFEI